MKLEKLKEYAKLTRLKAMGVSTIAVFGALSVKGVLEISHFIILLVIGIAFNILGFVLNDYIDINIDKRSNELSERPLVRGTITRRAALIISIFCYILIFGTTLIFFRDFLPLLILIIAVVFGTIYDCLGKRFLGSDFILAGSIALFCLFGALTVSYQIELFTWIIVFLIFTHVLFFNIIEGGFKDANNDKKSGAKTTAVYLGVKTAEKMYIPKNFKILAISIESASAFLVILPFIFILKVYEFDFWYIQILILLILIASLFLTLRKMLKLKSFDRKIVRSIITQQEIKRYIVAAVLLMSFAGMLWSLVLILLPIVWYLFFAFLLYDKPFRTSRML